ncbi:MAG: type I-C CRISPR-associated protein Cas8c/Csd1 [Bacteroidales bacterium]|nr:type I-C CRISPR-associated protein Cas8c/Csd1 [Bacteroidales bacterium]
MILKALYDYYNRCDNLPAKGMEEKEIGFLIVLSPDGHFLRFEDCRTGKDHARVYLVKKHVGRSSAAVANYLYDNSAYVLGYSEKSNGKEQLYFDTFKAKVESISELFPDNKDLYAIRSFYNNSRETILDIISLDVLWEDIKKNLSKKYSTFSFRIEGDLKIVAEKKEILQLEDCDDETKADNLCLVSGKHGPSVDTTTATMIAGSQATAKLVAFQVNSGYDSYGKSKCGNAPISEEAEFAYTTALNSMLQKGSRNKFMLGSRTFVFWASNNKEASKETEESLFELLGFSEDTNDDPNANLMKVRKVFESIYSGIMKTGLDDKFYILGLAPNSARIAVIYWSETTLKDFAEKILCHFNDMEIHDTRKDKKPYMGIREIISSVTLGGKLSDATPNLPEAVVKSIFQGLPYPQTLYSACIRRIRAEQKLTITRAAIIKAYLNRQSNNNKKIDIMLDKDNNNQGYLCGRLFAVLDKIQEDANNISSIRERYMNSASATPSAVFATILNLSVHHSEKLDGGRRIYFEKLKQEILDKVSADGFPTHLDLQDQGRFFVGYYHQRQDFFTSKKEQ